MKRLTLLIAISFFSVSSISANNFKLGVMIGANSSANNFDTSSFFSNYEAKLGFNANVFSRIKIGNFFLQPELGYFNNRTEITVMSNNEPVSASLSIGNLYGSTLLGFKFSKLRFCAGPLVYMTSTSTLDEDFKDLSIKKLSDEVLYGGQVGLGFDISKKWAIDMRYHKMFSDSDVEFTQKGTSEQFSGQYGTLSFSIGYSILNLGK